MIQHKSSVTQTTVTMLIILFASMVPNIYAQPLNSEQEVLDRQKQRFNAAMEQDTVVTVDIGNGGFAAAGRHKSRIIGEIAGVRV